MFLFIQLTFISASTFYDIHTQRKKRTRKRRKERKETKKNMFGLVVFVFLFFFFFLFLLLLPNCSHGESELEATSVIRNQMRFMSFI